MFNTDNVHVTERQLKKYKMQKLAKMYGLCKIKGYFNKIKNLAQFNLISVGLEPVFSDIQKNHLQHRITNKY